MFEGFTRRHVAVGDVTIHCVSAGQGDPVLLLHGYPQTLAEWARLAPLLTSDYTVVCADLRGYGDSSKPPGLPDHSNYSFRAMAADQVALYHQTNKKIAMTYWQWYFLPQPAPYPETLIGANPDYYFESCLVAVGGKGLDSFDPDMLAEYRRCWRDPAMIHASCCDYRAGSTIDLAHDEADLHVKLACPTLAVWGADGLMRTLMDIEAQWRARCANLRVGTVPGGHWFPEHAAPQTAQALRDFFTSQGA